MLGFLRSTWFPYLLLYLVGVGSRLALGLLGSGFGTAEVHAGYEASRAASALVARGEFGDVYPNVPGPSAHVSPIYPLILAGIRWLHGDGTRAGYLVQFFVSASLASFALMLLPALARGYGFRPRAGWIAAFALAFAPIPTFHDDISGCWEQPLATILLESMLLLVLALNDDGRSKALQRQAAGILLGLIALTSPALLLAAGLPLLLQLKRWRDGSAFFSPAFMVVVLLMPWTTRNAIRFHEFIPLRSNFGLELAIGNNSQANGHSYFTFPGDMNSPFYRVHPFGSEAEQARLREVGEPKYMREKREQALGWIRQHPQEFLGLCANRLRMYYLPPVNFWGRAAGAEFRCAVTFAFSALGLLWLGWLVVRDPGSESILLASAILGAAGVYIITHVELRYRSPVNGLLALLAADALLALGSRGFRFFATRQ